jgi:integrase
MKGANLRFIDAQLDQLPDTSACRRLRFALHLLYATGLRLAQVVAARVDDLTAVTYPPGDDDEPVEGWELKVIGKGDKERPVPVPLDVMGELATYLVSRGLAPDPRHALNRGAYLLGKAVDVGARAPWSPTSILQVDPKAGITAGRLYKVLKAFFSECAEQLARTDPRGALAAANTHWLRHAHGAQSADTRRTAYHATAGPGRVSLAATIACGTSAPRRRMQAGQNCADKPQLAGKRTKSEQ